MFYHTKDKNIFLFHVLSTNRIDIPHIFITNTTYMYIVYIHIYHEMNWNKKKIQRK